MVHGLDEESLDAVNRMLSRFLQINMGQDVLYTQEEMDALKEQKEHFVVMKLKDDCYAWRNYLLPINYFEPLIFYYKYEISKLKHLDR
ncbi:MAG: hypothetical protein LBB34_00525, partial [Holosporales bacterium]|nr:hypothetical protein [Holosporales bacterium]